jgi:hypothetical protein
MVWILYVTSMSHTEFTPCFIRCRIQNSHHVLYDVAYRIHQTMFYTMSHTEFTPCFIRCRIQNFVWNRNDAYEWSYRCTNTIGLMFKWSSTLKSQLSVSVLYKVVIMFYTMSHTEFTPCFIRCRIQNSHHVLYDVTYRIHTVFYTMSHSKLYNGQYLIRDRQTIIYLLKIFKKKFEDTNRVILWFVDLGWDIVHYIACI